MKSNGISSYKRQNKNTQSPFALYVAVKLYSSSRSKTPANWQYFCTGISLSYKSLLELIRSIGGNRMISQYNIDCAFLPHTLKKVYWHDNCKREYQSNLQVNIWNKTLPWNIIICFSVSNRREHWYSSRVWRCRTLIQTTIFWKLMHFHVLTFANTDHVF